LKIAIFTHGIVIVDPLAEERPAIYQHNLCIADSTGLSSFVLPLLPLKSAKSREIPRKFKRIEVQVHPRSSTLLPIESAYATSYYSLIVTLDMSRTVSEILTHKARKSHFRSLYCDCRPLAEKRPAIYQRNLCIADSTALSSFVLPLLPLKSAKSREIPRKFELIAVQGHPRSSTLVSIESAYATSY